MRRVLERAGYDVAPADEGRSALTLLEDDPRCDLLLTDLMMPDMWGDELCRRARHVVPGLRSLFVVSHGERLLEHRCCTDAAILRKPFSDKALLRGVAECLGDAAAPGGAHSPNQTSNLPRETRKQTRHLVPAREAVNST